MATFLIVYKSSSGFLIVKQEEWAGEVCETRLHRSLAATSFCHGVPLSVSAAPDRPLAEGIARQPARARARTFFRDYEIALDIMS
jgi:hypothetical protein